MKLYPPVIDNKLPAFYGNSIAIPFKLNKTVSPSQIKGAVLLIKSAENNKLITKAEEKIIISGKVDNINNIILFDDIQAILKENVKLVVGQYYKIQIAFMAQNEEIGYYSNVGVVKYIKAAPHKDIIELNHSNNIYTSNYSYTSLYTPYPKLFFDFINNQLLYVENVIECIMKEKLIDKSVLSFYKNFSKYLYTFSENLSNEAYGIWYNLSEGAYEQLIEQIQSFQKNILNYSLLFDETLYSYYFNLYDTDKKTILDSSGVMINTAEANAEGVITNTWYTFYRLEPYKDYYIEFGGTTINGLELDPVRYQVQSPDTINLDINSDFVAKLDYENGCIDISLQADSKFNSMIKYKFLISRASDKDNYTTWEPIMKDIKSFNPENSNPNIELEDTSTFHIWTDCTIEQGVSYIYALQAYNDYNIFSNPIYSNRIKHTSEGEKDVYGDPIPVLADFEHAYLFDGKRQLKLAFNPKVSSFKNTILESKVDTLGGKYPFFFRNTRVKYKEFSISGLISCLMDIDDKFLTGVNQLQLETHNNNGTINILDQHVGDTQLTSTNIYKERNFKMEVLEWLTNGQPKIFRSPTEGNFIVRLMNTSLSPNDTVGRMLHTFSSTAYEMADYTFDNLREYGFVDIDLTFKDRTIYVCQANIINGSELNFSKNLKYLKCEITEPHQGDVELNIYYTNATAPALIKFRGAYIFPADSCNNITKLSILPKQKAVDGVLQEVYEPIEVIWAYETPPPSNNFNYIKNIILSEESNQFIGGLGQINEPIKSMTQNEKSWQQIDINNVQQKDIIQNELSNIEREVGQINYLKIYRRHIEDCWYKNGICYSQASALTPETFAYADSLIYRVITNNGNYMVWRNALGQYLYITEENFNASNPYQVILNDQILSLEANEINSKENLNLLHTLKAYFENSEKDYYFPIITEAAIESTSINEINKLKVGLGLNVEMDYYVKTFEYDVDQCINKPADWSTAQQNLQEAKDNLNISQENYVESIQNYEEKYNTYLEKLEEILKQLREPEIEKKGGRE